MDARSGLGLALDGDLGGVVLEDKGVVRRGDYPDLRFLGVELHARGLGDGIACPVGDFHFHLIGVIIVEQDGERKVAARVGLRVWLPEILVDADNAGLDARDQPPGGEPDGEGI